MTTVYDVPAEELIKKVAEELEKNPSLKSPSWATFVKTGVHNERPPDQKNWWYIRASSILRRIYLDGPVGVARLRTYYGGKKNRGHKPEKKRPGSGAVIRTILQQLQDVGYVESKPNGRIVTHAGKSFLDKISHEVKLTSLENYPGLGTY